MTNIDNIVFNNYVDVLINRNKFNENQLTEFYIELNNIISLYNSKNKPGTYLVLAVMINFDKSLSFDDSRARFCEKVITDFATWYNKNYRGNYIAVIDEITNGFRNFMMLRKGNFKTYIPKIVDYYNRNWLIPNCIIYSALVSITFILFYYFIGHANLAGFSYNISNYAQVVYSYINTILTYELFNKLKYCNDWDWPFQNLLCHNNTI